MKSINPPADRNSSVRSAWTIKKSNRRYRSHQPAEEEGYSNKVHGKTNPIIINYAIYNIKYYIPMIPRAFW